MAFKDSKFTEIKEQSGYGAEGIGSIKEIVLRQIRKIGDICASEFLPGYWENKPHRTAGGVVFTKEYHMDTRQAYCNAVDFLIDIVYPLGDSKFKEFITANEKEIKEINEKLKHQRKIFKEINIMFERVNFFVSTDSMDE